ncbi:hypothetical protein H8356DRAFT_1381718 [Neocallimastix lanati (nom. inval.)]|nr:hypothetical protein H8356DRAFT_1381718 [Neocallimastix sp. JGI-2020a]
MDINQDNLTEKLQLLKLLIQKGRFETGVSDDVDELDEFVDGESMGILALVDNKEARCILKGYGENNLVNRSFLEKYILNHCIDDSSITGITKLTILNLTIGGVQKNVIFRVVEKENPFYDVLKQGTSEFRVVAELEKLSVLNKIINKNEENNNNNNDNIYNNNNNNNNKINNTKNDAVDDIINEKLNKLNALKLDNFRENNKLVNNSNSKCKTNNNIIITKEENKNNIKGSANIKKNQNNNIEINSIVIINNKENINSNGKNKNINNNSENIRNKINSHTIVKEEININESVKVDCIINRINKSITSGLVTEINIIDSNNSKVDNIQITSNANKNEQFIKKKLFKREINNNNSPVDFSNIINVGCDKKIKINKIKKIIKIPYIYIQNNDKNKINIYKIMIPKPEIALNEIINYNNNREL